MKSSCLFCLPAVERIASGELTPFLIRKVVRIAEVALDQPIRQVHISTRNAIG